MLLSNTIEKRKKQLFPFSHSAIIRKIKVGTFQNQKASYINDNYEFNNKREIDNGIVISPNESRNNDVIPG